jgi:hypothetical protein
MSYLLWIEPTVSKMGVVKEMGAVLPTFALKRETLF